MTPAIFSFLQSWNFIILFSSTASFLHYPPRRSFFFDDPFLFHSRSSFYPVFLLLCCSFVSSSASSACPFYLFVFSFLYLHPPLWPTCCSSALNFSSPALWTFSQSTSVFVFPFDRHFFRRVLWLSLSFFLVAHIVSYEFILYTLEIIGILSFNW